MIAEAAAAAAAAAVKDDWALYAWLFALLLSSCIGWGVWRYGRKQASATHLLLGAALMGYSYFVSNTIALYSIGAGLTLLAFVLRD